MLLLKKVSKPIVLLSTAALLCLGGIGIANLAVFYQNPPLVTEEIMVATLELGEPAKESSTSGVYELYSVKLSDESRFKEEEWVKILKQIEKGEVILEEE